MPKELNGFLTFSSRGIALLLSIVLVLWAGLASPGSSLAGKPNGDARIEKDQDWSPAESWAWSEIKQRKLADFDAHCGALSLDPKKGEDWRDDCRLLSSGFLEALLTKAPWQEAVPFAGIRIAGARIAGDVNLENAKLSRAIEISGSRIEGAINLRRAHTDSLIRLTGSLVTGDFNANDLHSESDLLLGAGAVFKSKVGLRGAEVTGEISLIGATIDGLDGALLDADSLQSGSLLMRSEGQKASAKEVILSRAKVSGEISMDGASFGRLDAGSLQAGHLFMQSDDYKASFKEVNLSRAKVSGEISMTGASIDGKLGADFLEVGGALFMRSEGQNKASFKDVNLSGAKVAQIDMTGATFKDVNLRDAKVTAHIDMTGVSIDGTFNLSGASVTGDLRLGGPYESRPWAGKKGEPGTLILRNAHIGNLADAKDAWPERGHLYLDGFSFTNLGGGIEGNTGQEMRAWGTGQEMRARGMDWWDKNWARLAEYSPGPYAQLAAALTNSGDRQAANEIRFLGREAERADEWKKHEWGAWPFRSTLCYVAGYGIGLYTFRVVWCVLGLSLIFAALLWCLSPEARKEPRGAVWCFGASMSRLLPGIEINREFADFFNDPNRERLKPWPGRLFSGLGMLGWLLFGVLIAAVSGLTQSS